MKKKILIISGGISKERVISLDTGKQVANELDKNGYPIKISEPNFNLQIQLNLLILILYLMLCMVSLGKMDISKQY